MKAMKALLIQTLVMEVSHLIPASSSPLYSLTDQMPAITLAKLCPEMLCAPACCHSARPVVGMHAGASLRQIRLAEGLPALQQERHLVRRCLVP